MSESQNPLLNLPNKPRHVAIIMDGNRRWSHQRGLPYTEGHKKAIGRIDELTEFAAQVGIEYVTYWAWSTKNWKRNPEFIKDIITLFRDQLGDNGIFKKALKQGAELHHLGVLDKFPEDIQKKVKKYLSQKPIDKKIDVNIAVGYEGRDEIMRAIKKIIKDGVDADSIDQELVTSYLDTSNQPDVDLVIRTGGEKRTSGYLIWQAADAEFYFTETLMPDFGVEAFSQALLDYSSRERRMGGDSKKY